jgi:uncharacterized delta-60 repeat protein
MRPRPSRRHVSVVSIVLSFVIMLASPPQAMALEGSGLDTSFGVFGVILVPTHGWSFSWDVFLRNGDRLLAVGADGHLLYLSAYRNDGVPTAHFGDDGTIELKVGPTLDLTAARDADGRIVVARTDFGSDGELRIELLRFTGDGSFDPTFGRGGRALIDTAFSARALALAIEPDGSIVVAGCRCTREGDRSEVLVARVKSDGSVDRRFGRRGWVVTPSPGYSKANDVAVQSDGKIVVAVGGSSSPDGRFAASRYRRHGGLDPAFAGGGTLELEPAGDVRASGVAVRPTGEIVVAGDADDEVTVWQLDADGGVDLGFGDQGRASHVAPPGLTANWTDDLLLRSDGSLATAVELSADDDGLYAMGVVVIDDAGNLVQGWGDDGWGVLQDATPTGLADDPTHHRILEIGYRNFTEGAYLAAFA